VVGVDCLGTRTQEAHPDLLDSSWMRVRSSMVNKVQGGKPHLRFCIRVVGVLVDCVYCFTASNGSSGDYLGLFFAGHFGVLW
jgi:hypothetical protein